MRNIRSGMAAVITKEKLFNRRVVLGAFIVLASALASYLTMATYVPAMVHAQESHEDGNKREYRSTIASTTGQDKEDKEQEGAEVQSGEQAPMNGTAEQNAGSQSGQAATGTESRQEANNDGAIPEIVKPIDPPREVIADSHVEREVRRENSRPSPVVASQFNANGCSKRGTSLLRHYNKEVRWNNYGEYNQGTRGECVKSIQRKLNQYCKNRLDVDGQYGPRTANAVRAYQHYMRSLGGITVNGSAIHVDGIAGAQTFALMQEFGTSRSFLSC